MTDEVCYSTVDFTKSQGSRPVVRKEDETVYAEVNKATDPSTKPIPSPAVKNGDESVYENEVTFPSKEPIPVPPEKPCPCSFPCGMATVCLGLLCAVLMVIIIALCIYYSTYQRQSDSMLMGELQQLRGNLSSLTTANWNLNALNDNLTVAIEILQSDYRNLTAANVVLLSDNKGLTEAKQMLQMAYDNLSAERISLNQTLQARGCTPCPNDWKLFSSKCYYFPYFPSSEWKTWDQSRTACTKLHSGADLVIIDNQQERNFITENCKYYFDIWHGYWIGLRKYDGTWRWVNDVPMPDGYWSPVGSGNCMLAQNGSINSPTNNWRSASCDMLNQWICEMNALIIPV